MGNSVASGPRRPALGRKYLNHHERLALLQQARQLPDAKQLFVEVLCWTGARVSEVLALTPASIDMTASIITIQTLKRRRCCFREVPIPPELSQRLNVCFAIVDGQRDVDRRHARIWSFCRSTGWRVVKALAASASVFGVRAAPRGFRHGFGIGSLHAGVPMPLLQRWLGHAHLKTTAIYADFVGPDELEFARRFWAAQPMVETASGI